MLWWKNPRGVGAKENSPTKNKWSMKTCIKYHETTKYITNKVPSDEKKKVFLDHDKKWYHDSSKMNCSLWILRVMNNYDEENKSQNITRKIWKPSKTNNNLLSAIQIKKKHWKKNWRREKWDNTKSMLINLSQAHIYLPTAFWPLGRFFLRHYLLLRFLMGVSNCTLHLGFFLWHYGSEHPRPIWKKTKKKNSRNLLE